MTHTEAMHRVIAETRALITAIRDTYDIDEDGAAVPPGHIQERTESTAAAIARYDRLIAEMKGVA